MCFLNAWRRVAAGTPPTSDRASTCIHAFGTTTGFEMTCVQSCGQSNYLAVSSPGSSESGTDKVAEEQLPDDLLSVLVAGHLQLLDMLENQPKHAPGQCLASDCREEVAEKQLRDDLLSMLVAGHETTGSALTWTLHLLASNPATLAKVRPQSAEFFLSFFPSLLC